MMEKFILMNYTRPIIVAFGNPLVDILADPPSATILEKYKLQIDGQVEFEAEKFESLCQDADTIIKRGAQWPGGSVQNTARLFQWIIGEPGYTVLFGAVGDDNLGKFLQEQVATAGVVSKYFYHTDRKTGTCVTFVDGPFRTLVAHIGAANNCPVDLQLTENRKVLDTALLVLTEGFFLTHSFETVKKCLKICHETGCCFGVNLSAPYVCENFASELMHVIEKADIICGNVCEYLVLLEKMQWAAQTPNEVADILQKQLGKVYKKRCEEHCKKHCDKKSSGKKLPRLLQTTPIILITNGDQPVVAVQGLFNPPKVYPVQPIPEEKLKDTTGAGDAFLAGFLAALFCDYDLDVSVDWGNRTASVIIQSIGVGTPSKPPPWI